MKAAVTESLFMFAKGHEGLINVVGMSGQGATLELVTEGLIKLNTNRVISYFGGEDEPSTMLASIRIRGWLI